MAPLGHSGDVASQWQVGQSHRLCQLHRQITASCPAHLQDSALPPLVQLRRLRLQKAVPSRATQGCAARWSPLPATAPQPLQSGLLQTPNPTIGAEHFEMQKM